VDCTEVKIYRLN